MNSIRMFVLLAAATHCIGQSVDIRGVVKDASTDGLISGAIVHLQGTGLRDTSDLNGEFRIMGGQTSLFPGQSVFHQARSGIAHMKIFRLASAQKVSEFSAALAHGWYAWAPGLPAGMYFLEIRTATSATRLRFLSLGAVSNSGTSPIRLDASDRPALPKAGVAQDILEGSRPGYFPRSQALDTTVREGVVVLLRRLGSFDGLWIGKLSDEGAMMMAIEGDSLVYARGPDSLVSNTCTIRGIFEVPSIHLPAVPSGHIANDSLKGAVPVDLPRGRYRFDMAGSFATDSTAAGEMDLLVDQPWFSPDGAKCTGSLTAAWTAVKAGFNIRFDGSWRGIDSKGDSLRFGVHRGRLDTFDLEMSFRNLPCGTFGGFGTTGFPYWVLPDGRFSVSHGHRESESPDTYRLDGRFSSATSASGTAVLDYLDTDPDSPCAYKDTVTWTATRKP